MLELTNRLRQDPRGEFGRLIEALPLGAIVADHLIRDRGNPDEAAMAALVDSLRNRGQQVPIEVVALEGGRYGLISGWRRVTALRQLSAETGAAAFATVRAVLRQPRNAAHAYVAMVEENEIRLDLSHYERAGSSRAAWRRGCFPTRRRPCAAFSRMGRARGHQRPRRWLSCRCPA